VEARTIAIITAKGMYHHTPLMRISGLSLRSWGTILVSNPRRHLINRNLLRKRSILNIPLSASILKLTINRTRMNKQIPAL
jgi:hypothetical protein